VDFGSVAALLLRGRKDVNENDLNNEDVREDQTDEAVENENSDAPAEDLDLSAAAVMERQALIEDRAPYEYDAEVHGRDYRVEGNDVRDYVGVDPEYMTYANPTEAPMLTDTERWDQTTQYDHLEGNADEELDGDVEDNESEDPAVGPENETVGETVEQRDSEPGSAGAEEEPPRQSFNPVL
jgi:hypothetical protein